MRQSKARPKQGYISIVAQILVFVNSWARNLYFYLIDTVLMGKFGIVSNNFLVLLH